MLAGKDVCLVRYQQFGRSIGEFAQNCLAADHHDVFDVGDRSPKRE